MSPTVDGRAMYDPDELPEELTLEDYYESYPDGFKADVEATFLNATIPGDLVVCPICEGKGSYVNPSIDSQGLSAEDFDEAGDEFREDYFKGVYDKRCECCEGSNVVNKLQYAKYLARLADHRERMAEQGERYGDSRL